MKLAIKNMVCDRCKRVVREELEALGLRVEQIDLGTVEVEGEPSQNLMKRVEERLVASGFELLEDPRMVLVEQIKTLVIDEVQYLKGNKPDHLNFSDYLAEKCGYDYSYLSHLFSTEAEQTIEHYIIAQKIEKVKELLSYGELTQSETSLKK
jgi:AraC-like DNA-binding protein